MVTCPCPCPCPGCCCGFESACARPGVSRARCGSPARARRPSCPSGCRRRPALRCGPASARSETSPPLRPCPSRPPSPSPCPCKKEHSYGDAHCKPSVLGLTSTTSTSLLSFPSVQAAVVPPFQGQNTLEGHRTLLGGVCEASRRHHDALQAQEQPAHLAFFSALAPS